MRSGHTLGVADRSLNRFAFASRSPLLCGLDMVADGRDSPERLAKNSWKPFVAQWWHRQRCSWLVCNSITADYRTVAEWKGHCANHAVR